MISNWFPTREPPTSLRPVSSLWSEPILLFDFSFHYKNNKRRKIPCLVFFPAISFSFFLSFFFWNVLLFRFVNVSVILFPPYQLSILSIFFFIGSCEFTGFYWVFMIFFFVDRFGFLVYWEEEFRSNFCSRIYLDILWFHETFLFQLKFLVCR